MSRAGEVEQVGLAGALTGHTPSRMEVIILSLGAALIDLTRRTRLVCATKTQSPGALVLSVEDFVKAPHCFLLER